MLGSNRRTGGIVSTSSTTPLTSASLEWQLHEGQFLLPYTATTPTASTQSEWQLQQGQYALPRFPASSCSQPGPNQLSQLQNSPPQLQNQHEPNIFPSATPLTHSSAVQQVTLQSNELIPSRSSFAACPEQLYRLPGVEEQVFASPALAQRAMNLYAREHVYAVVYKGTSYDKLGKRLIRYGCDRHGVSRGGGLQCWRVRPNTMTRKCGCPMEVYLIRKKDGVGNEIWELQHRGRALLHNHLPSSHAGSHPIHRRASRTEAVQLAIAVDSETGTSARQACYLSIPI
ncbi:hypothetical protein ON010_g15417 [Phytophthora cinnamomi]|nr:hypothetical protein ON010_g15417 [Phytophthora cinnamomi]